MFHFLKNTIMVPDFMARQACEDSIVITQWADYQYCYTKAITENHVHCSKRYSTFEQWYQNNFKNDLKFLEWIYNTREIQVRIYADSDTYAKLVIKWIKFICPSLSVDQVYKIYRLSMMWFYTYQVNMRMNTTDQPLVEYDQLIDHYRITDYETFNTFFDSITFDQNEEVNKYKELVKNYISNEFKYAFYMNGDQSFESMVIEHVNKALVRCLKMELEQYKYVSLFDIVYNNIDINVDNINSELFDIIKNSSKTLPNDQTIQPAIDQLYQYGNKNDQQLLTHNNVLIDDYYNILSDKNSLTDKLDFIANIANDGIKKSEFVDCFSSSYNLYNLLLVRWIITMYRDKDPQLSNFVY